MNEAHMVHFLVDRCALSAHIDSHNAAGGFGYPLVTQMGHNGGSRAVRFQTLFNESGVGRRKQGSMAFWSNNPPGARPPGSLERRDNMLAGIYLGGDAVGRQSMDVHRHATFSCSLRNFFRSMVNLFRR